MGPSYVRKKLINYLGLFHLVCEDSHVAVLECYHLEGWQIRVFVDYQKLNRATICDSCLLPFIDSFLDIVAGLEVCRFIDSCWGYNQIQMMFEDRKNCLLCLQS